MKKLCLITASAFISLSLYAGAEDGSAIYTKDCAKCHGADGKGATTMGKKMKCLDYSTAEGQKWSDADGVKAILEGKEKMKGYKDKGIDEAAAKDLVKYIRAFKK